MAGGSLAERHDAHQHGDIYARKSVVVSVSVDHRAARTRHPDAIALDAAVQLAAFYQEHEYCAQSASKSVRPRWSSTGYWMTWSVRSRTDGGIVSPSAFAVFA